MTYYPPPPPPEGVDEAAWLTAVLDVRSYCGWHVAPEVTETVTVDGSGSSVQMLPTMRLVDLTSITNDGETVSDPEWSAAGFVRGVWTGKLRGVTATMTHGYEDWPEDLLGVVGEIAAAAGRGRVSQVTSGSHQVSFDVNSEDRQQAILNRYRLVSL